MTKSMATCSLGAASSSAPAEGWPSRRAPRPRAILDSHRCPDATRDHYASVPSLPTPVGPALPAPGRPLPGCAASPSAPAEGWPSRAPGRPRTMLAWRRVPTVERAMSYAPIDDDAAPAADLAEGERREGGD